MGIKEEYMDYEKPDLREYDEDCEKCKHDQNEYDDYNEYDDENKGYDKKYEDSYMKPLKYGDHDGYYEDEYKKQDEFEKHHKKMIEVDKVVGIGRAETTLETCVNLYPPAFEVFEDLIGKKVIFDAVIASKGKVFINGRIIKNIPYKTKVMSCYPPCSNISKITFGNVKHVTFETRFALCIDVPGAKKGDKVVILKSEVESVEIPSFVPCKVCEPEFLRMDTCTRRLIKSITEKDCVTVKVKVVRPIMMCLPPMPFEMNDEMEE